MFTGVRKPIEFLSWRVIIFDLSKEIYLLEINSKRCQKLTSCNYWLESTLAKLALFGFLILARTS